MVSWVGMRSQGASSHMCTCLSFNWFNLNNSPASSNLPLSRLKQTVTGPMRLLSPISGSPVIQISQLASISSPKDDYLHLLAGNPESSGRSNVSLLQNPSYYGLR